MKKNYLRRVLSLVLSVAVVASSMPAALAFAEEDLLPEVAVEEILDAEIIDEEAFSEVPEETVDAEMEAQEEITLEGIDVVEAELANAGINAKPATVAKVVVRAETEEYDYSCPEISWSYVPNCNRYEVSVTDGTYEYKYSSGYKTVYGPDEFQPSIRLSDESLIAYDAMGNPVLDANGSTIPLKGGVTYSVKVRAVNSYDDGVNPIVYTPGDWSASVNFKLPTDTSSIAINDLQYTGRDSNNATLLWFTYGTNVGRRMVHYQISAAADFSTTIADTEVDPISSEKLRIRMSDYSLQEGVTYYIRAYAGKVLTNAEITSLGVTAKSFVIQPLAKTAKNITGLERAKEDENDNTYAFRFNEILDNYTGDKVQFQYCTTSDLTWKNIGSALSPQTISYSFYRAAFTAGSTDTIKVRAMALYLDASNNPVYGAPSNVVEIPPAPTTISSISNLALKEYTNGSYRFSFSGKIHDGEMIEIWVSQDPNYIDWLTTEILTDYYAKDGSTDTIHFSSMLEPGKTYYARARVVNVQPENSDSEKGDGYSAFISAAPFKTAFGQVYVSTSLVSATSVRLDMECYGDRTGFEVQRKTGKSYATVAKTTDHSVTDSGLKKNTAYKYRVRAYYYDQKTKKTSTGDWVYAEAFTWGNSLNLKAVPVSATSVKLSWNKVADASGYEIYRQACSSSSNKIENGQSNEFKNLVKVKTIKKGKTTAYKDKKLSTGVSYEYFVQAYKKIGKKKYYINSTMAKVDLKFSTDFSYITKATLKNGTVKIEWNANCFADGFLVEKWDEIAENWNKAASLPGTATGYTLPATTKEKGQKYQIRAFKGKEYSDPISTTVAPYLAAPTNVKAVANNADGSITVTWNPVSGADYYEVYRSNVSGDTYNKDGDFYTNGYIFQIFEYVPNAAYKSGYARSSKKLTATKLVDRPISHIYTDGSKVIDYTGPSAGYIWTYYVRAYKNGKTYNMVSTSKPVAVKSGLSKGASASVTEITTAATTIKKVKVGKKKATVSYKAVTGAVRYDVYYSTKKNGTYTLGASSTSTSAVVNELQKGKKYYFKVVAVKENEAGADTKSAFSANKKSKKIK